jgi:aspartate/methionine/tyrosine aminotransferase
MNNFFDLPKKFEVLDAEVRSSNEKVFISDWNGTHPFVSLYLGDLANQYKNLDVTSYSLHGDDNILLKNIGLLHQQFDGIELNQDEIMVGNGATSLLSAFCFWIKKQGFETIHYLPPLHHTIAYMINILGLKPCSISQYHAFESQFSFNLPNKTTVLLLTDPIWHTGKRLSQEQILTLKDWQRSTKSIIFVDGTFQYMQWNGDKKERSGILDINQTIRLICPTKYLSIHGFRFAYMLLSEKNKVEIEPIYDHIHGASSIDNLIFAHKAIDIMLSKENNQQMIDYVKDAYYHLINSKALIHHIIPECGYFVFGCPHIDKNKYIAMDQSHFEQQGFPNYIRINLLNKNAMKLLIN